MPQILNLITIAGSAVWLLFTSKPVQGQQWCTNELISNPCFDVVDNLELPVDWNREKKGKHNLGYTVDTAIYVSKGPNGKGGALKVFAERADEPMGRWPVLTQRLNEGFERTWFMDQPLYLSAWVRFHGNDADTNFQLVLHQANSPGGPPWYIPVEWSKFYQVGTETGWRKITGEVRKASNDVNNLILRIYLRTTPSCTAWVDNIRLSTDPNFTDCEQCEETIVPSNPTAIKTADNVQSARNLAMLKGRMVTLAKPTTYRITILSPDGKRIVSQSGFGSSVDLNTYDLVPGYYIVHVSTTFGNIAKPLVISMQ